MTAPEIAHHRTAASRPSTPHTPEPWRRPIFDRPPNGPRPLLLVASRAILWPGWHGKMSDTCRDNPAILEWSEPARLEGTPLTLHQGRRRIESVLPASAVEVPSLPLARN